MNDGWYATPDLRIAIKAQGWDVRTLAAEIGYSKSHLYNVLNGRLPMRKPVAQHIVTLIQGEFSVLFVMSSRKES